MARHRSQCPAHPAQHRRIRPDQRRGPPPPEPVRPEPVAPAQARLNPADPAAPVQEPAHLHPGHRGRGLLLIHPDNPTDALFILAVLLLNAAIGGFQEYKAERSSQALLRLLQIRASVLRDGEVQEMDAEQVVPGDVVWLESGNRVPADLRLLTSHGLEIDESLLTGESLPVHKDQQWSGDDATPMADQRGRHCPARPPAVVVATGPPRPWAGWRWTCSAPRAPATAVGAHGADHPGDRPGRARGRARHRRSGRARAATPSPTCSCSAGSRRVRHSRGRRWRSPWPWPSPPAAWPGAG